MYFKQHYRKYKIAKILGKEVCPVFQKVMDFVSDNFIGLKPVVEEGQTNYKKSNGDVVFTYNDFGIILYSGSLYNRIDGYLYSYGDDFEKMTKIIIENYYNLNVEYQLVITAIQK